MRIQPLGSSVLDSTHCSWWNACCPMHGAGLQGTSLNFTSHILGSSRKTRLNGIKISGVYSWSWKVWKWVVWVSCMFILDLKQIRNQSISCWWLIQLLSRKYKFVYKGRLLCVCSGHTCGWRSMKQAPIWFSFSGFNSDTIDPPVQESLEVPGQGKQYKSCSHTVE